jgi:glutaredoxin
LVTVYGAVWCEDTQRSVRQLRRLGIAHEFRDVDTDHEGLARAKEFNNGRRRTPVIELPDGEVLIVPSNRTLVEAATRNGLVERARIGERMRVQNIGDLERALRIGAAVSLGLATLRAPRRAKGALLAIGAWELATGILGWCPVYSALRVTSLGGPLDHPLEADRETWLAESR